VTYRVVIDRHKCVGAGTCIYIAPTAFRWAARELLKAEVLDPDTVEEEVLREAAAACPTQAISIESTDDPAPWARAGPLPVRSPIRGA
jgi:ferredoxin